MVNILASGQPNEEPAAPPLATPSGATDEGLPPTAERDDDGGPPPIVDVWSRAEPKYRVRAVVLLLLTLMLFCGMCVFTHWLHVARPFDFSLNSYTAPMKFWGEQTQNLNDFVLYPISVEQTPMHAVVLGLLVATIVAVPISVAILYGFPYALPFVAAVFVFAHLPWMALTLVGCCILAAVKPFRLSFRFGAALVGMLPVILYLYLATRGTPQQIETYASPDQKLALAAPWILAILAACAMLATILLIARIVNYRPGAVPPVMAVMFATPAILFHVYVGFDEVSYRVLEAEYGPRSQRFAAHDVTGKIREAISVWIDDPTPEQLLSIVAGQIEPLLALHQWLAHQLQKEFLADRRMAYEACRRFIADHPGSRYVPNVLYIQAWVLDSRVDARKSSSPGASLRRELYSDFPHVQSEEAWRPLLNKYADSPLAIAARLRIAQLHLRRGEVAEALDLLAACHAPAEEAPETQASTQPVPRARWLRAPDPESSLGFEPGPYLREGERLRELILANKDDTKRGTTPLQKFASLDPHRPTYREQLLHLAEVCRDALLYDNLVVEWAATAPDRVRRVELLDACIYSFPNGDAVAKAIFRLAELEIQARGEDSEPRRQRGLALMHELRERFPDTYWGREAAERLRALEPRVEPGSITPVQP